MREKEREPRAGREGRALRTEQLGGLEVEQLQWRGLITVLTSAVPLGPRAARRQEADGVEEEEEEE